MSTTLAPNVKAVSAPGKRTVYSMCGMCAVRCPMEVTVEDGRATWLQGNENDKAIGASLCAKGAAGLAFEADDQRPQTPLIRTGPRGSGQWRRASWDEALDHIADKLKATIERHGARAIALSDRAGPFTDLTRTFLKALGSPNYVNHDATCGGNVHNAARSIYGFSHAALVPDFSRVKHIVLYGRNIVESLMVKEVKAFMAALGAGMRCTYVDPRASATAAKATRFWQVRPNSDYALNLALIHEVLRQKAYDEDFVERFVSGMDVLREAVKDTTPDWQEAHTGVPARELREFVAEIAGQVPQVIFNPGWMTARHKQSFYVSRTALILNALMGNLETPGGYIIAKPPEAYGRKSLKSLAARAPAVTEPRVDGAGTTHPTWDPAIGMLHPFFAAMQTAQPYAIGAYIAYRHDPLTAMPDAEALKQAMDKLDLLVSIDVRYSETGWYSDVILPESTYLERANILAGMPGPVPLFMMRDQALAPRFDSRPAWWIFREILRRMGKMEALDFETIEEIWNYQLEGTGVTVAEMRESGVHAPGGGTEADAARPAQVPHALGQDRDRQRSAQAGRPAGLPALRRAQRARGRPVHAAVRAAADAGARPVAEQPTSARSGARAGAVDPHRPRRRAGHPRRCRGRGQRWRRLRRPPEGQGHAVDPPRGRVHAARLRRHGAAGHARTRRRRRRPAPAARQAA